MALLGREFIAVPDDRKGQIVFKWPDKTNLRYARAIVNADEMAMFVNTGQVVQTLGPGRHQIDANELPGLGSIIDAVSGGEAHPAGVFFGRTRGPDWSSRCACSGTTRCAWPTRCAW